MSAYGWSKNQIANATKTYNNANKPSAVTGGVMNVATGDVSMSDNARNNYDNLAQQQSDDVRLSEIDNSYNSMKENPFGNQNKLPTPQTPQTPQTPRGKYIKSIVDNSVEKQSISEQKNNTIQNGEMDSRADDFVDYDVIKQEFNNSVDSSLVDFVEDVKETAKGNERWAKQKKYPLSKVGAREQSDIKDILGIDVTDYQHAIRGSTILHIDKRHGGNGNADHSMSNVEDIAKIQYVLDNYDEVKQLKNLKGETQKSNEYKNSDGSPSDMLIYEKRINGSYYLVEAVPDSKTKQLQVVTAYMGKSSKDNIGTYEVPHDKKSLGFTSKTKLHAIPNTNIPQNPPVVNRNSVQNDINNANNQQGTNQVEIRQNSPAGTSMTEQGTDITAEPTKPKLVPKTKKEKPKLVPKSQKNNTIQDDGVEYNTQEYQAESILKNHNIEVAFVDDLDDNINGLYKDGKVIISTKSKQPFLEVAKHELTHHINNTKFHSELNDFVVNYMKENKVDIDGVKSKLIKVYADNGVELDEQGVNNELVAKFVGSKLFTSDSSIKRLAQTKPDLFTTIKNWISDMAVKFTGTAEEKTYRDLEKRYIKALDEVKGVDRSGEVVYSIRTDVNDDKYVNIDEDILEGVPKSDWKTKVKAVLKEKFSNGFALDEYGTNIKVNATSRNEFTNSRYTQSIKSFENQKYQDKMRMASNVDEMKWMATEVEEELPKHTRKDSFKNFNRGKVKVKVGNNSYAVDVVTGVTSENSEVFYDVVGIESIKIAEASPIAELNTDIQTAKNTESTSTINSISQSNSSVNSNSMQNSKKYSLGDDDFDGFIKEFVRQDETGKSAYDQAIDKYGALEQWDAVVKSEKLKNTSSQRI